MAEELSPRTMLKLIIIPAIFCIFLTWFVPGCKKTGTENDKHHVTAQTSDIGPEEKGVVTLGEEAQKRGGVKTAPVKAVLHTRKIRAFGVVLQLQELTNLRNDYVSAKTQLEKARTDLGFSRKEYERLKALNEDNKNVSDKAVQAALAALKNDEGNLNAAREAVDILENTARQQWGDVIARWLIEGSPALQGLLRQKDVLVQLTLPAGTPLSRMPEKISVMPVSGGAVPAAFVSLSPRMNPHIQGTSLFYVAPFTTGNLPTGADVTADLPLGPAVRGIFVPASSVVLWQGRPWVYVRLAAERFKRRQISVDVPMDNGYFSAKNLRPGEQIVVKGAQVLLSEESRPKTSAGEEDED
jgi:hypothetical protein